MTPSEILHRIENMSMPEPNSGCWLWCHAVDGKGYGRLFFQGRSWRAHRLAAIAAHGDHRPLRALHSCDTPACVNPAHLRWGTDSDNMQDAVKRGRIRYVTYRGEQHPNSKLSAADVEAIRALKSVKSAGVIGSMFGISRWQVRNIWLGKCWKPSP